MDCDKSAFIDALAPPRRSTAKSAVCAHVAGTAVSLECVWLDEAVVSDFLASTVAVECQAVPLIDTEGRRRQLRGRVPSEQVGFGARCHPGPSCPTASSAGLEDTDRESLVSLR